MKDNRSKSNKILWWITRILSSLLIAFSVYMFVGYTIFPDSPSSGSISADELIGMCLAGTGILGLALAWKWELTGGIIAFISFLALGVSEPSLLRIPFLYFFPLSALLFIVLWIKNRQGMNNDIQTD